MPVATPADLFVDLPGRGDGGGPLRLHVRDWGGGDRPLLLLHGLASNARIWDLTAPYLVERLRVLALDQRGHGLSDKPASYGFDQVAGDTAALIRELSLERPLVAGHSWGGNVALELAARHPELVSGIILVDGGFLEISSFDGMSWERVQQLMAPPRLDGIRLEDFLRGARSWPGLGEFWNDDIKEIVLANFRIGPEGTIHPYLTFENHMKILRSMWKQHPSLLWERVQCPVLMVPALRDNADPRSDMWTKGKTEAIAIAQQRLAKSEVVWMEDTIHDVPLQRPRELGSAIVRFAQTAV